MAKRMQLNALMKTAVKMGNRAPLMVTTEMVEQIYDAINNAVFGGVLVRPKIIVRDYSRRGIWGECEGWQRVNRWGPHYTKIIRIERSFPNMKKLIGVVAHEMVHQWEWDMCGVMTHGTSTFFAWQDKLLSKGIRLYITM